MLEEQRVGYAVIDGSVKDRTDQVSRFQNDHACTVFVGQIAMAGLGITLTAASTMVFHSLDYSMSNFEQAKARILRVGQKENCAYIPDRSWNRGRESDRCAAWQSRPRQNAHRRLSERREPVPIIRQPKGVRWLTTESGLFTFADQLKELRDAKDGLEDQLKGVNA
ncbi:MAG: SWF/SNF helicase family protein [Oscillospiraceae bacterium]|nr:SWF/SNF helicase family protein [Oscillospiraceae bacterium]